MICSQDTMREEVVHIPGSKFGALWPGNPEVSENRLEVGRRHRGSRWAPSHPLSEAAKGKKGGSDQSPWLPKTTIGAVFYKCLFSADSVPDSFLGTGLH